MSTTNNASGPQSNATPGERQSATDPGATADSLQREAELARQAFARTLNDLKHSLETAANPCQWAQQHPWIAVGVAAAAGFAAASAVMSHREPPAAAPSAASPASAASSAFTSEAAPAPAAAPAAGNNWSAMLFELAKIVLSTQLAPILQMWLEASAANRAAAGDSSTGAASGNDASSTADASSGHDGREAAAGQA
jgi:hypothetical protein